MIKRRHSIERVPDKQPSVLSWFPMARGALYTSIEGNLQLTGDTQVPPSGEQQCDFYIAYVPSSAADIDVPRSTIPDIPANWPDQFAQMQDNNRLARLTDPMRAQPIFRASLQLGLVYGNAVRSRGGLYTYQTAFDFSLPTLRLTNPDRHGYLYFVLDTRSVEHTPWPNMNWGDLSLAFAQPTDPEGLTKMREQFPRYWRAADNFVVSSGIEHPRSFTTSYSATLDYGVDFTHMPTG